MLARFSLLAAVILLTLSWLLVRRARRKKRPVGPLVWGMAIFAAALLVFVTGHAIGGELWG